MVGLPVDPNCRRCPLAEGRTQVVAGLGPRPAAVVLVGEAPGETEDKQGQPFVGRAGALLDGALEDAGVSRGSLFITNVVKCRPPGNRRPAPAEVEACRPFLEHEIEAAGATVLVGLGKTAAEALLAHASKVSESGTVPETVEVAGKARRVFVTLHPASSRFRKGARASIAAALRAAADAGGLPPKPRGKQSRL